MLVAYAALVHGVSRGVATGSFHCGVPDMKSITLALLGGLGAALLVGKASAQKSRPTGCGNRPRFSRLPIVTKASFPWRPRAAQTPQLATNNRPRRRQAILRPVTRAVSSPGSGRPTSRCSNHQKMTRPTRRRPPAGRCRPLGIAAVSRRGISRLPLDRRSAQRVLLPAAESPH